ncbi:MAG: hypothetical protein ACTMIA_13605 [Vibrio sp.]
MMKTLCLFLLAVCFSTSTLARTDVFPASTFDQLNFGLYWFGANNQYEKASSATSHGSQFYDPQKPTLIFIHGWQNGHVARHDRIVYFNNDNGWPSQDFANIWRSEGYNVGILYWDQFADEKELKDAEAKVWTATGHRDMRWLDGHGTYHSGPKQNVVDLLLNNYDMAMQYYTGPEIRLAGHSLGNQVALRLADKLTIQSQNGQISPLAVPKRVSLLDPFYSNYPKSYLDGAWVGEKARAIVQRLKSAGTVIDSYRSSIVTSSIFVGDENKALSNAVAFTEISSQFFNQFQISEKHSSAVWLYLWSILYPAPVVTNSALPGLSASSTYDEVRQWMQTSNHLIQSAGGYTKNPQDNLYEMGPAL